MKGNPNTSYNLNYLNVKNLRTFHITTKLYTIIVCISGCFEIRLFFLHLLPFLDIPTYFFLVNLTLTFLTLGNSRLYGLCSIFFCYLKYLLKFCVRILLKKNLLLNQMQLKVHYLSNILINKKKTICQS